MLSTGVIQCYVIKRICAKSVNSHLHRLESQFQYWEKSNRHLLMFGYQNVSSWDRLQLHQNPKLEKWLQKMDGCQKLGMGAFLCFSEFFSAKQNKRQITWSSYLTFPICFRVSLPHSNFYNNNHIVMPRMIPFVTKYWNELLCFSVVGGAVRTAFNGNNS